MLTVLELVINSIAELLKIERDILEISDIENDEGANSMRNDLTDLTGFKNG